MPGFNPQTGLYDMNYNGSNVDFGSISGYGAASPTPLMSLPGGFDPSQISTYGQTSSSTIPGVSMPTYNGGAAAGAYNPKGTSSGIGFNLPTLQTGMGVLQTGANLYSAFEQTSLAKQQLAYAKEMGNANLANQMASYNTNLTSQANMSAKVGGWTPDQTAAYLAANKLTGK